VQTSRIVGHSTVIVLNRFSDGSVQKLKGLFPLPFLEKFETLLHYLSPILRGEISFLLQALGTWP
jgi:hypothetical protein